jgi:hypothetical protein
MALFTLLLALLPAAAAGSLDDAYLAVVQLPSHGASGTIIATAPGETLILTVAHAFAGPARRRPIVVLVPTPQGASSVRRVGIRLVAIDPDADLALVALGTGPLPHAAALAPRGTRTVTAYSCGYDAMRLPAVCQFTRVLDSKGPTTVTERAPGHGRSGGALFDADSGCLVGVVQGYTVERRPVGLYASLDGIHTFLTRHGYGRVLGDTAGSASSPSPAAGPGAGGRPPAPAPARPCPQ